MSSDRALVVIARVGTDIGKGCIITEAGLREMAKQAGSPYIVYDETRKALLWDGPADAYYDYFINPSAAKEAQEAINKAMRR